MAETKALNVDKYINQGEAWFSKFPSLPKGLIDFIVVISPWIALIFGVLGLLASLGALGLGTILSPVAMMAGGARDVGALTITAIIGIAVSVLYLVAVPSLFSRKIFGWKMLLLGEIISVVGAILTLSIFSVVLSVIWFYFIFQIKPRYK